MNEEQKEPTSRKANRLSQEKSPYLLQHAHNPVDWFPWGDEAFAKSKAENKPILLSIGYATCHWCHVMERESFEDENTAKILNENFVAIKVDREERPDVDQIYMKALHALGQHGGWPLNMFLTPEKQPITGGTYFPPTNAYGRPSFIQVLESIQGAWSQNRDKILESAKAITDFIAQEQIKQNSSLPTDDLFQKAIEQLRSSHDIYRGGFLSNGPNKFPPSLQLLLLLHCGPAAPANLKEESSPGHQVDLSPLEIVENTVDHMRRGGIYDQVGGGLSRYATDHDWLVPHFEKMLYDNSLFAIVLIELYRITRKSKYKEWAEDIFQYWVRDMRSPSGAFYSAEDADSEGEEGKFYLWTARELESVLSDGGLDISTIRRVFQFWGVTTRGNFEGKTILSEVLERDSFLKANDLDAIDWEKTLQEVRGLLLVERSKRPRPFLDDKILTSWNALAISALALAGRIFESETWTNHARTAADFLLENLIDSKNGGLRRRFRDGEAKFEGGLTDYSLLGCSLIDLYRASGESKYILRAKELAEQILTRFSNPNGGFFDAPDSPDLLYRAQEIYDGVEPSGNSAAIRLFLQLSAYGFETLRYREIAKKTFEVFAKDLGEHPTAYSHLALAYYFFKNPSKEFVFAGDSKEIQEALLFARSNLGFDSIFASASEDGRSVPLLEGRIGTKGIYVCEEGRCELPIQTLSQLKEKL